MVQDLHPLAAREIQYKEPEEELIVNFNLTDWQKKAPTTTVSSIEASDPAPSVDPAEEHRQADIGAVTGGPFRAGEVCIASGGATCKAVAATADGDATMAWYIDTPETIAAGETITGSKSGATCVTASVETKVADGVLIASTTSTGQFVQVKLTDGLRPLEGRQVREYVVRLFAILSDGQKVPLIGKLRIPAATQPDNPS